MIETKTKRIVCEMPADVVNRFLTTAKLAGTDSQKLLRDFVSRYVGDPPPQAGGISREQQKWVDMLLAILRSGDKGCIQAVTSNLIQFERVIRLASVTIEKKLS